jgi:hypothetical protein
MPPRYSTLHLSETRCGARSRAPIRAPRHGLGQLSPACRKLCHPTGTATTRVPWKVAAHGSAAIGSPADRHGGPGPPELGPQPARPGDRKGRHGGLTVGTGLVSTGPGARQVYPGVMTDLHLAPEVAAVVARARGVAEASGELYPGTAGFESPLSPAARAVIASWIADGGYRAAVMAVAAEDPELADQ